MPKRGREKTNKSQNIEKEIKKKVEKVEEAVGIKKRSNPWMYSTIALLVLLVISVAYTAVFSGQGLNTATGTSAIKESGAVTELNTAGALSIDDAADRAVNYINNYILQGGQKAVLKEKKDAGNGLYELKIDIGGRIFDSYVTADGKLLFPSAIDLTQKPQQTQPQQQQGKFDAPDREKTNVKFFVMSFCPFGNQAESGLEPVYRLLKDKVEWEPHYVIYSNYRGGGPQYCIDNESKYCSMHGIQELNQDIRELCVWKYYNGDKWWDFVLAINKNCNSKNADTCWEQYAREAGIDVERIKKCQQEEWPELLARELELNQEYGVRGSPTVIINDQRYAGARTPDAYLSAICSGFTNPPEECGQEITTSGTETSSAPPAGGCGG